MDDLCVRLKVKYVMHELKERYPNPKQRYAIGLSVSKKFCKNPKENINKTFLNGFSVIDLKSVLGSANLEKVNKEYKKITKGNIVKWILNKI